MGYFILTASYFPCEVRRSLLKSRYLCLKKHHRDERIPSHPFWETWLPACPHAPFWSDCTLPDTEKYVVLTLSFLSPRPDRNMDRCMRVDRNMGRDVFRISIFLLLDTLGHTRILSSNRGKFTGPPRAPSHQLARRSPAPGVPRYTPQISACCLAHATGKPKAYRNRERSYGCKKVCDGFSPLFWLIVQPGMADAFQKHMLSPGQESQCRRNLFMRRQTTRLRISLQEQHRTANCWQEHVRIVALIYPSLIKEGGEDFWVQMLQVLCPQARHLFLVVQPSARPEGGHPLPVSPAMASHSPHEKRWNCSAHERVRMHSGRYEHALGGHALTRAENPPQ